ncbi:uncharacterized protein LOC112341615 [Selaginella moellendorffii]|uniref:uncharacterized protein LOC112341615 n=1 Tax=Selaginella moellendorffii TaxID=88036 RepID=UPI000D1D01EE|nr:uncharacterized protein LOC112341615 [Selaginella moellendorffii]|eukprot:XP_024517805.1 uncharacterized protein LOC112341615 [Selaginella moellendorffii]
MFRLVRVLVVSVGCQDRVPRNDVVLRHEFKHKLRLLKMPGLGICGNHRSPRHKVLLWRPIKHLLGFVKVPELDEHGDDERPREDIPALDGIEGRPRAVEAAAAAIHLDEEIAQECVGGDAGVLDLCMDPPPALQIPLLPAFAHHLRERVLLLAEVEAVRLEHRAREPPPFGGAKHALGLLLSRSNQSIFFWSSTESLHQISTPDLALRFGSFVRLGSNTR